ncbi:MAG: glycine zipper domain-containing protein [Thermodesulfobacteriota bacterium]
MKRAYTLGIILMIPIIFVSCATLPPDRYNTQKGALIGAGAGALIGQAIGHNTAGTLIGLAAGTILGGLVGNAIDQDYQVARDAALYDKPVIYYDRKGSAVEAIPGPPGAKSNCRTVTKRTWQDGKIVSETVEEVCSDPPDVVVVEPRYVYPAYPAYPSFYFHYGWPRPYYYRPHWHGHYGWGRWHRW